MPDLFGRVREHTLEEGYEIATVSREHPRVFEIDPLIIKLTAGGADGISVYVPAGTPMYGGRCHRFLTADQRFAGHAGTRPCWVPVGLAGNATTAAWLQVVPASEPLDPFIVGRIAETLGPFLILEDDTVIRSGLSST